MIHKNYIKFSYSKYNLFYTLSSQNYNIIQKTLFIKIHTKIQYNYKNILHTYIFDQKNKKKIIKINKNKDKEPWWNEKCWKLKIDYIAAWNNWISNIINKQEYLDKRWVYRKALRDAKLKYGVNIIDSCRKERNARKYWQIIGTYKDKKWVSLNTDIKAHEWLDHFRNTLNGFDDFKKNTGIEEFIENYLINNTDVNSNEIKEVEINRAIKSLKNNKAAGMNKIANEAWKAAKQIVIKYESQRNYQMTGPYVLYYLFSKKVI